LLEESSKHTMRHLGETRDVGVHVETHTGLGVPETTGKFHSLYSRLMPKRRATVPETVGTVAAEPHRVSHLVTVTDLHRETFHQRLRDEGWYFDSSPYPLAFGPFSSE